MISYNFNSEKLWNDLDSKRRSSGLSWNRLESRLSVGKTTLLRLGSHKHIPVTTIIPILKYLGKSLDDYVVEVNDAYSDI